MIEGVSPNQECAHVFSEYTFYYQVLLCDSLFERVVSSFALQ